MSDEMKKFPGVKQFLLDTPLYVPLQVKTQADLEKASQIFSGTKFDGHCMLCKRSTTYSIVRDSSYAHYVNMMAEDKELGLVSVTATCARHHEHKSYFWIKIKGGAIEKHGQWPSLADLANDESKQYRSVLDKESASELHKAIGLAAHGVGIGSFVYLRRIFERLIWSRFREKQAEKGWDETKFKELRMGEKVSFLKDNLPAFLVKNSSIYSILSAGLHELTEEECLSDFAILKQSIVLILDEDRRRKEAERIENELAAAITERASKISATDKMPKGGNNPRQERSE